MKELSKDEVIQISGGEGEVELAVGGIILLVIGGTALFACYYLPHIAYSPQIMHV